MSQATTAASELNPKDDCKIPLDKLRVIITGHLQDNIARYARQRGSLESLEASFSDEEIAKLRIVETTGLPKGEGRFARKLASRLGIAIHEQVPLNRMLPERKAKWRRVMEERGAFSVGLCGLEIDGADGPSSDGATPMTGDVELPEYPIRMFVQRRIIDLL